MALDASIFEIDGTLISTGSASDRTRTRAFKKLQGVDVDVPAVTGKGVILEITGWNNDADGHHD